MYFLGLAIYGMALAVQKTRMKKGVSITPPHARVP
jgi:hypothetical protein